MNENKANSFIDDKSENKDRSELPKVTEETDNSNIYSKTNSKFIMETKEGNSKVNTTNLNQSKFSDINETDTKANIDNKESISYKDFKHSSTQINRNNNNSQNKSLTQQKTISNVSVERDLKSIDYLKHDAPGHLKTPIGSNRGDIDHNINYNNSNEEGTLNTNYQNSQINLMENHQITPDDLKIDQNNSTEYLKNYNNRQNISHFEEDLERDKHSEEKISQRQFVELLDKQMESKLSSLKQKKENIQMKFKNNEMNEIHVNNFNTESCIEKSNNMQALNNMKLLSNKNYNIYQNPKFKGLIEDLEKSTFNTTKNSEGNQALKNLILNSNNIQTSQAKNLNYDEIYYSYAKSNHRIKEIYSILSYDLNNNNNIGNNYDIKQNNKISYSPPGVLNNKEVFGGSAGFNKEKIDSYKGRFLSKPKQTLNVSMKNSSTYENLGVLQNLRERAFSNKPFRNQSQSNIFFQRQSPHKKNVFSDDIFKKSDGGTFLKPIMNEINMFNNLKDLRESKNKKVVFNSIFDRQNSQNFNSYTSGFNYSITASSKDYTITKDKKELNIEPINLKSKNNLFSFYSTSPSNLNESPSGNLHLLHYNNNKDKFNTNKKSLEKNKRVINQINSELKMNKKKFESLNKNFMSGTLPENNKFGGGFFKGSKVIFN